MIPPNLKKRLFKKEYSMELLKIALGDLESSEILFSAKSGRPENVVFMAQQSVEKSIKAVLVYLQIAFPMVHDLGILIALLPDAKAPPDGFELTELNPFASVRRYEEGNLPLTSEELEVSLAAAKRVYAWAIKIIT